MTVNPGSFKRPEFHIIRLPRHFLIVFYVKSVAARASCHDRLRWMHCRSIRTAYILQKIAGDGQVPSWARNSEEGCTTPLSSLRFHPLTMPSVPPDTSQAPSLVISAHIRWFVPALRLCSTATTSPVARVSQISISSDCRGIMYKYREQGLHMICVIPAPREV